MVEFNADSIKILQVFRSWSEDVKLFGYNPQIIFLIFFSQNELSHFFDQSE